MKSSQPTPPAQAVPADKPLFPPQPGEKSAAEQAAESKEPQENPEEEREAIAEKLGEKYEIGHHKELGHKVYKEEKEGNQPPLSEGNK